MMRTHCTKFRILRVGMSALKMRGKCLSPRTISLNLMIKTHSALHKLSGENHRDACAPGLPRTCKNVGIMVEAVFRSLSSGYTSCQFQPERRGHWSVYECNALFQGGVTATL